MTTSWANGEVWKNIPGVEDAYQVSNLGRIRKRLRELKPYVNWDGYLRVDVTSKDGKKARVALHRLVALAFVPNPDNKPHVNHLNGDRADCRAENLQWATNSENQRHRRSVMCSGGNSGRREVVCLSTGQTFDSLSEAARKTGNRIASVQECCKGKRKTTHGLEWAYKE